MEAMSEYRIMGGIFRIGIILGRSNMVYRSIGRETWNKLHSDDLGRMEIDIHRMFVRDV